MDILQIISQIHVTMAQAQQFIGMLPVIMFGWLAYKVWSWLSEK
jgi:hypothetical protein